MSQPDDLGKNKEPRLPSADTGNASNPSPHDKKWEPPGEDQLLNERSEKYLRESANIEDEPEAQDLKDADERLRNAGTGG